MSHTKDFYEFDTDDELFADSPPRKRLCKRNVALTSTPKPKGLLTPKKNKVICRKYYSIF